jgi:copper chaperone
MAETFGQKPNKPLRYPAPVTNLLIHATRRCSTHQTQETQIVERDPAALTLRVEDMTCGHCAGTIKKAIETGLPGTQVEAEPASKLVSVRGSTDLISIKALVTEAGYTPTAA